MNTLDRRWALLGALSAASAALVAGTLPAAAEKHLYVAPHEVGNRGFFTAGGTCIPKDDGWTNLYNGKDLSGWHVINGKMEAWKANGDMISTSGGNGGWLTSDKIYGDFEMKIDYRIPAGGNSGLGLRYPAVGDPAHAGMEIQMLDDDAAPYKNLKPAQYTGGIYYQVAPLRKAAKKPGEWNRYEVRAQGSRIRIKLNGIEIQNVDVATVTKAEGNYKPLAERPRVGHVGVQNHGNQVDFKNIYIREL